MQVFYIRTRRQPTKAESKLPGAESSNRSGKYATTHPPPEFQPGVAQGTSIKPNAARAGAIHNKADHNRGPSKPPSALNSPIFPQAQTTQPHLEPRFDTRNARVSPARTPLHPAASALGFRFRLCAMWDIGGGVH